MATSKFKLDPANASSFASTSIDSVVDWSMNISGTPTDINTDGNTHVQGTHIDNLAADITFNCTNPKQFEAAAFYPGSTGTLVLKGIQSANTGSGTVATTITRTFTNVTVVSVSDGVPHEGNSTATITFRAGDNGSGALYTTA